MSRKRASISVCNLCFMCDDAPLKWLQFDLIEPRPHNLVLVCKEGDQQGRYYCQAVIITDLRRIGIEAELLVALVKKVTQRFTLILMEPGIELGTLWLAIDGRDLTNCTNQANFNSTSVTEHSPKREESRLLFQKTLLSKIENN